MMNVSKLRKTLRILEKRFGRDVELTGLPQLTIADIRIRDELIGSLNFGGTLEQGNGDILIYPKATKYIRPGQEKYQNPR
jgi:hypothetical protein